MTTAPSTKALPTTEVWFRNPANYIRELVEVPTARNVIWDRGFLAKRNIDPHAHASLYFGKTTDWRILVCGEQGTAELGPENSMKNPIAVYPTWVYGEDDMSILEEMLAAPLGQDMAACRTKGPADEVPVYGQENRIILTGLPSTSLNMTKALLRNIRELMEEYAHNNPILHLHATYAFSQMFSLGFGATDVDPRTDAQKGKIVLPTGKVVKYERAQAVSHWIQLLDMSPTEMKVPRNRCIYNIKSSMWAGQYWTKDLRFKTVGKVDTDPRAKVLSDARGARTILGNKKDNAPKPGDMVLCNTCSLQDKCKFYRDGAVCSVPESEVSELAKYFNTRDAGRVIDGLGTVLGAAAARLERGVEMEEDYGELDPEVTKMMNQLITNGMKYAKLLDPTLAKPNVTVNVGRTPLANGGGSPRQLTTQVVRAIQDETGLPVKDITAEMVGEMLARMAKDDRPNMPSQPQIEVGSPQ